MKIYALHDAQRAHIIGAALAVLAFVIAVMFFVLKPVEKETEWKPGTPLPKERIKIGVIYISDVTNAKSGYSYAHELGIQEMQREIELRDDQIIRKNNVSDLNQASMEQAMRECIAEGANIIFATSWGYMNACEKLAGEYPNVIFAHTSGFKRNDANFTNYFGRVYQAWYLGGIIAGIRTATNKIGFVAAMSKNNHEVTRALNAFALGVESVNPETAVYVKVTHRWYDPEGESDAARSLIMGGCDVITNYTDNPHSQIEAQKAGVWGIGYNSDMSLDAPGAVITSIVWHWRVYYTRLVESVIEGTFTTEPYFDGLSAGIVDLTPFNEQLLPAGTAETVAAARKRIESGEFDVFEGAMETNDGRIVGTKGQRFSDAQIMNGIDWYYRNVAEIY